MAEIEGMYMKSFTKLAMLVPAATLGLSLAACDSKQENAAEDQAEAVRSRRRQRPMRWRRPLTPRIR